MRKQIPFKKLLSSLFLTALICSNISGHSFYAQSPLAHHDYRDECLHTVCHKSSFDEYFAYNSYGEFMFKLKEFSYGHTENTADYISQFTIFHNGVINSIQLNPASEYRFYITQDIYDNDRPRLSNTYEADFSYPFKLSFNHSEEYIWDETELICDTKYYRRVYDQNHNPKEIYTLNANGYPQLSLEFTYDEYGNILTETDYGFPANRKQSVTYFEHTYNHYGKPTKTTIHYADGSSETFSTEYMVLSKLPDEIAAPPYAGYWSRQDNGQTYFLCIAINNLLCRGYFDRETGLAIITDYARYKAEGSGLLHCEFFPNGIRESQSDTQDIAISVNGNQLVFGDSIYQPLE